MIGSVVLAETLQQMSPTHAPVETMQLRLGHESVVFSLRSHTQFQDLVKLRFLMSPRRKNSLREKEIGKKWICLEENALHRQNEGHLQR